MPDYKLSYQETVTVPGKSTGTKTYPPVTKSYKIETEVDKEELIAETYFHMQQMVFNAKIAGAKMAKAEMANRQVASNNYNNFD